MCIRDSGDSEVIVLGDCALNIKPTEDELVEIADTEGERPRRIFCGEGDETGAVFFRDDDIGLSRKAQRRREGHGGRNGPPRRP